MDRRQFVTRAAVGAAGAWVAPVVTSTPWAVAHASGSPCPGTSGRAYDVLALYSGPVSDSTGPVKEYPADPGSAVTVDEPLPNSGRLQASSLTASGGPTAPPGFATSALVQGLVFTTGQFLPLPLTGSATLLRTTGSCACGGATPSTRTATFADVALNVLGVTVVSPDPVVAPNTHAPGFPQTITVPGPGGVLVEVLADVLFNRQLRTVDRYDAVSALLITLDAALPGGVRQAASFEFARSEVRCLAP